MKETEGTPLLLSQTYRKHSSGQDDINRKSNEFQKIQLRNTISVSQLFRFASAKDKLIMSIGTIFAIVHGCSQPILGVILGLMANSLTDEEKESPHQATMPLIANYCVLYACLGVITFISSFIQVYCWELASASQAFKLRRQYIKQVLRQHAQWYDENQTGDLAVNLLDDLERFQEGVGQSFSATIQYSASTILGILFGLVACWQLTLVVLILSPLISLKASIVGKYVIEKLAKEKEKYAKAGCLSIETFSSNRTVAAFGGELREIRRYEKTLMEGKNLARKRIYFQAIGIGFSYFVLYICHAVAYWYGGKLLADGTSNFAAILVVMTSTMTGIFSLGHMIPYLSIITIAQAAAERIYKVIDTVPKHIDPYSDTGSFLDKIKGSIEFHNVYFSYPARMDLPVLKRLTFKVEPGQTIGLVGTSGSGKSTIVNLLLRFYDPLSGEVLIDGVPVNSLNVHWLREQIGYVAQEPVLFSTTIYENIALGTTKDVTVQEVIDAAKLANVHDFIKYLPQGYDTLITTTKLSGGQKQRIAIARAIISNPKILLLDEATSALDGKSEALVQVALRKAMKGRTTIIIAHRLSTIRDADQIHALKDGVIVESGNHEKLIEKKGLYYELVMAQAPLETVEDTDAYSVASTAESVADSVSEFEYSQRKRRHRTMSRHRSVSVISIDGTTKDSVDRVQLLREVKDLQLEPRSAFEVLKKSGQWTYLGTGIIGALIAGVVRPTHSSLFAQMLVIFSSYGPLIPSATQVLAYAYLLLGFVSASGYFINILFISWAGENLTMKLRMESFISVIRQQISWYDEETNSPARISARLARDAPLVNMAAGERLGIVLIAITTICTSLGVAFYFGWRLAWVMSLAFPALILSGYIQVLIQSEGQMRDSEYIESAGNITIESIQSIRTIQSLCKETTFYNKYKSCIEPVYQEAKKQATYFGLALALTSTLTYFVYTGAFYYGSKLVDAELMTQENVYRVFFVISFCAVSVSHMASFIPDFQKARLASALIFNLIELKSEIDPLSPEGEKPIIHGRIEFKDVQFSYPARPETKVLQGLSFKITPGQTLAVVGTSGSGKSTVVSLVERFYDTSYGSVMIDGVDIKKINIAHLRKHIGLVQQEPVLFDMTIKENIAYGYVGKEGPTMDQIIKSAKDANIHDFITKLPKGYDTLVGERAVQLSGGQKQRVAIARALIRDPRILLLDEATSALDTESEHIVQEALDKARLGRTCVVIAHRLSTIQNADVIAVVSNGKIIEIGSPESLIAKKGIYYKITKKQQMQYRRSNV